MENLMLIVYAAVFDIHLDGYVVTGRKEQTVLMVIE